jgi:ribosome recycling factor
MLYKVILDPVKVEREGNRFPLSQFAAVRAKGNELFVEIYDGGVRCLLSFL